MSAAEYQRARGIVLRRQPVTETSLIVTWFTREFGKLRTLAKGARRPKSPFTGKLDLFYEGELVFLPSQRSDLHLLHECFLENPRATLRQSVARLTASSYCVELVELIAPVEDPQPGMYALLGGVLDGLATTAQAGVMLLWFEMRLLETAGWRAVWEGDQGVERVLRSLAGTELAGALRVRLSAGQLDEARRAVWAVWDAEVGRGPRSRALLQIVR